MNIGNRPSMAPQPGTHLSESVRAPLASLAQVLGSRAQVLGAAAADDASHAESAAGVPQ